MAPQISIVTPSFNQAEYIEDTLRSVHDQGCASLEHLVIDGASTDSTVKILERYAAMPGWQYLHFVSEPDRCQSDAINKGLRRASGEIIGWLNSDDRYEPGAFAAVQEAFLSNPSCDFVYGDYLIIDECGKTLLHKREIDFEWDVLLCGLNYIAQPNVFFRRRVLQELGYLDESFHYVMDYEFWLRAASRGFRFKHISLLLASCRWQRNAKTVSQDPRAALELTAVQDMYWDKPRFRSAALHAAYRKYWNFRVRARRQWKKLRRNGEFDIFPTSWYMQLWRRRTGADPQQLKRSLS